MENNQQEKQEFKRSLSLLDGTLLVASGMIGSGIFIVSSEMGRTVGGAGWLILLWVLTGILTVFGALSYGELAGMMPRAGGQFVYIKRAWNEFTAFIYGWSVFSVIQTGTIAAVAMAFAKYTGFFFPSISPNHVLLDLGFFQFNSAQALAISIVLLLTFVNSKGVDYGKIIQLIFTSSKMIALAILVIWGLFFATKSYLGDNMSQAWQAVSYTKGADGTWSSSPLSGFALILALGTAIIGSLFSSDAWNNVTFIAGEMKNPKRDIPLSLFLGTLIVTILYVSANLAYLNLLPMGSATATDAAGKGILFATDDRVGTAAALQIFGDASATLMAGLIMISTFGCASGLCLAGARVYYAMAEDGLFFKKAAVLNKNGVPGYALWIQGIWTALLCLTGSYGDLLSYATFVSLVYYIVTIWGIFRLRKSDPDAERPYKVPGYPITPIIYIVLTLSICFILLYTQTRNTVGGLVIIAAGIPFYYLVKSRQKA